SGHAVLVDCRASARAPTASRKAMSASEPTPVNLRDPVCEPDTIRLWRERCMHDHGSCREPIRLTALASCVLAALGFTATGIAAPYEARMASPFEASGGVQVVTNCNDNGAGSLRAALALAGENDTVDLTALDCGTIALT